MDAELVGLRTVLASTITDVATAVGLARDAGVPIAHIVAAGTPDAVWRSIFDAAHAAGLLRALLTQLADRTEYAALAPTIRDVLARPAPGATSAPGVSTLPRFAAIPFTGRAEELAALGSRLVSREYPITVVYADSGVGKTRLAVEAARRFRDEVGADVGFIDVRVDPVAGLYAFGKALGVASAPGESPQDYALRTRLRQARRPTLLVYDDVPSYDALEPWLPDESVQVLVTSTASYWPPGCATYYLSRLSDADASALIATIVRDPGYAETIAPELRMYAQGNTVQLVAQASAVAKAHARGLTVELASLEPQTVASFTKPWELLDDRARLFLRTAALYAPSGTELSVPLQLLELVGQADGLRVAVEAAADSSLIAIEGTTYRMHGLAHRFVRDRGDAWPAGLLEMYAEHFVQAAEAVNVAAGNIAVRSYFLAFGDSHPFLPPLIGSDERLEIGHAHLTLGRFDQALVWFKLAVEAREREVGVHANADARLGESLDAVGRTLSEMKRPGEAHPWHQRAVQAVRRADPATVDMALVGGCLHGLAVATARIGLPQLAGPIFVEALQARMQVNGGVAGQSSAVTLAAIGACLVHIGDPSAALAWYAHAFEAAQRGDRDGPADHDVASASALALGGCLARLGRDREALEWLERAADAGARGDRHGRVSHDRLTSIFREITAIVAEQDGAAAGLRWARDALTHAELGDVFGRVDRELVARCQADVAVLQWRTDDHRAAVASLAAAVDALEGAPSAYASGLQELLASLARELSTESDALLALVDRAATLPRLE